MNTYLSSDVLKDGNSEKVPLLSKLFLKKFLMKVLKDKWRIVLKNDMTNSDNAFSNLLSMKDLQEQYRIEMGTNELRSDDENKFAETHRTINDVSDELSEMKEMFARMDSLVDPEQPDIDGLSHTFVGINEDGDKGIKRLHKLTPCNSFTRRNGWIVVIFLLIIIVAVAAFIATVDKNKQEGKR
ncbi:hypothetical protein RFI_09381 [Reticulomyxa filosa]|uniref:t-SNARE coiled-coil homology domain-containing protein n=1 Tax=Reticulomyxa filosa TaxID=46433 RepID=X6NP07_RETFI|nr:hypothetical protein RFI_09381 [Reticulomyxa filosa]|eukprot:ETO27756.1 hypothetical protein RFI_09381 [Reticulomyxa filosa]